MPSRVYRICSTRFIRSDGYPTATSARSCATGGKLALPWQRIHFPEVSRAERWYSSVSATRSSRLRWAGKFLRSLGTHSEGVDSRAREAAMRRLVIIEGALHEDAWRYRDWAQAMKEYFEALDSVRLSSDY